jgi:hypothetical protein
MMRHEGMSSGGYSLGKPNGTCNKEVMTKA